MTHRFKLISAAAFALACCIALPAQAQTAAASAQPAAAQADQPTAEKLKGEWTGMWEIGNFNGKFVLVINAVEGNNLKGEGHWYATATGDTKEALTTATFENGELVAAQSGGTTFKLKFKDDKTLIGSWALQGYTGPLKASRQ